MNSHPNHPRHPWARLTAAARTVRDDRDTSAPFGFATRIAALAMSQERPMASLFDVFALRALVVACLLAIFSVALNYSEMSHRLSGSAQGVAGGDDLLLPVNDAVTVVLALAD
jgi:hypothetical protein